MVGVALTIGVYNAFAPNENGAAANTGVLISPIHLANFLAFIALIIPFYHGAVRHLYATYVEQSASTRVKSWAVFFDFLVLFGEGCAFVFLAAHADDARTFLFGVVTLLGIDCVWGVFATAGIAGSNAQKAEMKWAAINVITIILIIVIDVIIVKGIHGWSFWTALCLLCIILLRTIIDYGLSWAFYFPPISGSETEE